MKKLLIALFAFAMVFGLAGVADAAGYAGDSDVSGTDTYSCYVTDGDNSNIDCVIGVSTPRKLDNIITGPSLNVKAVKKLATNDLAVYYQSTVIVSGDAYLSVVTIDLDTDTAGTPSTLLTNRPTAEITKDIASGETYPRVVYIDANFPSINGIAKIIRDAGSGSEITNSTPYTLSMGKLAVFQDPSSLVTYFAGIDSSSEDFETYSLNTSGEAVSNYTVSTTDIPQLLNAVMLDTTHGLPIWVTQDQSDKDIKLYSANSASSYATAATIKSLTNDVAGFDVDEVSGQVATIISKTDLDESERVIMLKTNEAGGSITEILVEAQTGATYETVTVDENSSNQAQMTIERKITSSGDAYLMEAINPSGSTISLTQLDFQQQDSAIPELPGNALWKVLIAALALGLVVGIAAFMKKKKK